MVLADGSIDLNAALKDSLLNNDLLEDFLSGSGNLLVLEEFSAYLYSVGKSLNFLEDIFIWLVLNDSSILLNSGFLLINIGHSTSDDSISKYSMSQNLALLWSDRCSFISKLSSDDMNS